MQSPSSLRGARVFDSLDEALDYTRNLASQDIVPPRSSKGRRNSSKKSSKNQPSSPRSSSRRSLLVPEKSPVVQSVPKRILESPTKRKRPGSERALVASPKKNNNQNHNQPSNSKRQLIQRSQSEGQVILASPSAPTATAGQDDKKLAEYEDLLFQELAARRVLRRQIEEAGKSSPNRSHPSSPVTLTNKKSPSNHRNPRSSRPGDIENQAPGAASVPCTLTTTTVDNDKKTSQQRRLLILGFIVLVVVGVTVGVLLEFDLFGL